MSDRVCLQLLHNGSFGRAVLEFDDESTGGLAIKFLNGSQRGGARESRCGNGNGSEDSSEETHIQVKLSEVGTWMSVKNSEKRRPVFILQQNHDEYNL